MSQEIVKRLRRIGLEEKRAEEVAREVAQREESDSRVSCAECSKLKRIDKCDSRKEAPMFRLWRCPDFVEMK